MDTTLMPASRRDSNTLVTLTIDGRPIRVAATSTVLDAARELGVAIPTLCWLENVNQTGSCRLCMVEIQQTGELVPSCATPVNDGMQVSTNNARIRNARRTILNLLMANHREHCFDCVKRGDCELQTLAQSYGANPAGYVSDRQQVEVARTPTAGHPFLSFDPTLCIGCQRCVSACATIVGRHAITTREVGRLTVVDAPFGPDWRDTACESCGTCAQVCPTAAIIDQRRGNYLAGEVNKVATICPHCGTGCQINLVVKDNQIIDAEAGDGPVNHGLVCVKGRSGSFEFVHSPQRLTQPLVKNKLTGEFEAVSWDEALDLVARTFLQLRDTYGGDSLAGFACGRSLNEDVYLTQKFVRTCFQTNNVDNCARVCHSASVTGLASTLGSGAMTNSIGDITDDVDCILLVGSNPEEAHPVIGMQIRQAVQAGAHLVVVDPRELDLCKDADIHLRIKPGTDVAFANGMLNVMIAEDLIDRAFIADRTEGFEAVRQLVTAYTPQAVAEICDIDPDMLRAAARLYATARRAPIVYCLGVTEHSTGTEAVMSLSNLAMATGKFGRPGCGVNPLRGQNNVQGACDMGALPTDFPGYQKLDQPGVMEKFERAWGVNLNHTPGLTSTQVFEEAERGAIKGLFIFGEDPVTTEADTNHVLRAFANLEFLVVDELFMTRTAQCADVILPGLSFAEKTGTFTNTERRIQLVRKAVEPGPHMRAETDVLAELMRRMGYPQPTLDSRRILAEVASLTPNLAGVSHERLAAEGSLQWPCPSSEHPGTPILHVGTFARGRGRFNAAPYRPAAELPDEEYPFILMTGRMLYHYNNGAMTRRSRELTAIENDSYIEVNEDDASRLNIAEGQRVRVTSRRGQVETVAQVGTRVRAGQTWMPFHFPDADPNWLTNAALDEFAHIPEYKVCAVKVEPVERRRS